MNRFVAFAAAIGLSAAVLSGCTATSQPIVDTKGVDSNQYAKDNSECQNYADQANVAGDAAIGARHAPAQQPRGDVLALRGELAREATQLEDVVVDRGRGHEGAETVTARDEVLALEHLERLAQRHEGHAEGLRERALVVEPGAGREAATVDTVAQRLGDAVVPRHPCVHADSSVGVLELRAKDIAAGAPMELMRATTKGT